MARTVREIEQLICNRLDLLYDHESCHFMQTSEGQRCANPLTSDADEMKQILFRLATRSPLYESQFDHLLPSGHSFSVVEQFRKLALNVLCPVHCTQSILTETILVWLNIASASFDLFAIETGLAEVLRLIHDQGSHPVSAEATQPWQRIPSTSLRLVILETLDGMFDPYFENFTEAITDRVVERLARQLSVTDPVPSAQLSGRSRISAPTPVQAEVSAQQLEDTSESMPEDVTSGQEVSDFGHLQSMAYAQAASPQTPNYTALSTARTARYRNNSSTISTYSPSPSPSTLVHSPGFLTPPSIHNSIVGETNPSDDHEPMCPICLEPLARTSSPSSSTPHPSCPTCCYAFHPGCLDQWIAHCLETWVGVTCPCCRSVLLEARGSVDDENSDDGDGEEDSDSDSATLASSDQSSISESSNSSTFTGISTLFADSETSERFLSGHGDEANSDMDIDTDTDTDVRTGEDAGRSSSSSSHVRRYVPSRMMVEVLWSSGNLDRIEWRLDAPQQVMVRELFELMSRQMRE